MKDVSLCEHIKDTWRHGLCVSYIAEDTGNAALCQGLQGQSRVRCFSSVAPKVGDVNLCDEAGAFRDECIGEVKKAGKN